MSEKRINEELLAIEAALGALKPTASCTNRDHIMFLAGQASAAANIPPRQNHKINWLWPCVTAASLLLAITSNSVLFLGKTSISDKNTLPASRGEYIYTAGGTKLFWYNTSVDESPKQKPSLRKTSSSYGSLPGNYLSLSRLVAEKGIEALPEPNWILIPKDRSSPSERMKREWDDVMKSL